MENSKTDTADGYNEITKLSESIFIYPNRRMSLHGNVFEGKIISGVYGVRLCAIKFAQKSEQNVSEAKILTKLGSHTHVVSIIQSGIHKDMFNEHVYIALDKCHKQNLRQYLEHRKESGLQYDMKAGLEYSKQIIAGLTYVHENLIFHKDLKPSNILLSLDASTIKIADFGLSQEIKSTSSKVYCKHQFGTCGFRPIEGFGNSWASLKSDIFSLGVVLYYILSNGSSPFGEDFHLWNYNLKSGKLVISNLLVQNKGTTEHLIGFMLSKDRLRRPSIRQVFDHPCWKADEVECRFEYGCVEEPDDFGNCQIDCGDVQTQLQNVESDDSESEIDGTLELIKAIEKMGLLTPHSMDTSIVIFDRETEHLRCLNPKNKTLQTMHEFHEEMKWENFSSLSLDNHIYILMKNGKMYRLKYRDSEAKWELMADLIIDHGWFPPAVAVSGQIMIAGASYGSVSKSVTKFDPSMNEWTKLNDKQLPTRNSANVALQKYVYCVGGCIDGVDPTNRVERFDSISQVWDEVASMREPRYRANAVEFEGKIILAGGMNQDDQSIKTVEKYDPEVNQWTIMKPMNFDRLTSWFRCHSIDGNIYAVGPLNRGIEKFDFKTDEWEVIELTEDVSLDIEGSVSVKLISES